MQEKFISIGKIINFHGIQGEVKIGYTKGKENQLLSEKFLYLKKDNAYKKFSISKLRFHKNIAIVKFEEINSINEAMDYKAELIYIPIENLRNNLETDEFLIDDLIGMNAFENSSKKLIGKIKYINKQNLSDLLVIQDENNKEYLVPFVKELVPIVDIDEKKVFINAIEGLLD